MYNKLQCKIQNTNLDADKLRLPRPQLLPPCGELPSSSKSRHGDKFEVNKEFLLLFFSVSFSSSS